MIIGNTAASAYCAGSTARFSPVVAAAWAGVLPEILAAQGAVHATSILTRGFVVKVIARIPALAPTAEATPPGVDPVVTPTITPEAAAPDGDASPPRRRTRRHGRSHFPIGSVTVLAILAAFAWSMASWNETRRLERARAERIARVQAAQATPGTTSR